MSKTKSENSKSQPEITTIVLTGGPSAGKSKALKALQAHLEDQGHQVYAMAETATELINGGISPLSCSSVKEFQDLLFGLQLAKEETYFKAARLKGGKSILLLDRGLIDNESYLSQKEFQQICEHYGLEKEALLNRYDLVFHLQSAATGDPAWYSTDNNEARFENPQEAILLDHKIAKVWKDHPNLHTFSATPECSEKIEALIEKADRLLEQKQEEKG